MNVILLGASTRAAAMSVVRAGWTPWCADLYADADLERIATVRRVPLADYPKGLLDALAHLPAGPVVYTGALENRPDLIARIDRPVLGNPPEVLRAVRSPRRWAQTLQAAGLPCPAIAEKCTVGRWLLKPRKSAGGLDINVYSGQAFNPRTHFLQEHLDGVPCSAVYMGLDDDAILLGVTRQLIGTPWLHATGFHYAGNIGPLPLDAAAGEHWRRIGSVLAQTFHLRGLFGVDAVEHDGVPWPVEINPRYTASVELLERAFGQAFLPLHCRAFEPTNLPASYPETSAKIVGKAILYARATLAFPERGPWLAALDPGVDLDAIEYADIPQAGEVIEQGRPVLTLFASAATVSDCETMLQEKADGLARCLWG
jgi:predicted ATP-grasp superfamily ATP-dependent carboligase